MKQNTDYGYDIQKLYLEMMLADAETFVRCQNIFDYTLFDRKLQTSAEFLSKYVTEQVGLPTLEDILKELEKPGRDPRDRSKRSPAEFQRPFRG